MGEIWSDIPGTNHKVQVNQLGQIRVKKRVTPSDFSESLRDSFTYTTINELNLLADSGGKTSKGTIPGLTAGA